METCFSPPVDRCIGLLAQLYSVRGDRDLGAGDFGTLRQLIDYAAGVGADFVGLNPLHALDLQGGEPCPYSPSSRLYLHALYLDLEAVPELEHCRQARQLLESEPFQRTVEQARAAARVDHAAVLRLKLQVSRLLHDSFVREHAEADTARGRAYRDFVEREGEWLSGYCRYAALAEHFGVWDFYRWPSAYHDHRSGEVESFAQAQPMALGLHAYLQFELDRQLGVLAEHARTRGLRLGLYMDLALGSAPSGADVWSQPHLFAQDQSVGAPPDAFSEQGQVWGLAPMLPSAWDSRGSVYFEALLDHAMRRSAVVRLDHAMGVRRQWWVPHGAAGGEGRYVDYPESQMLDSLARASHRNRCVVVAEDLGTVPEGFREMLHRRGILRSHVLYFERDDEGRFTPPAEYARDALTTANTHDLATLEGFFGQHDLRERRRRGALDAGQHAAAAAERSETLRLLAELFRAEGLLAPEAALHDSREFCRMAYELLARTPSQLLGISMDDLTGEPLGVNLPGTPDPDHDNWRLRLRRSLPELRADDELNDWLRKLSARGASRSR